VKTERLVLLTTPEFKRRVTAAAKREGVSTSELVRRRVEAPVANTDGGAEEALLGSLTAQLQRSVKETRIVVRDALNEINAVLRELKAGKKSRKVAASA
jgi:hypothetical protein